MNNEQRLNRVEDQLIDMRLAVSALLDTVTLHQGNFERIATELRDIRQESREIRQDMQQNMQEMRQEMLQMQSEIKGLQTENRRILDILQNRHTEE
jgi:hypothetical protein